MPLRDEWSDLARKLDWSFSYADERQVFPEALWGTYVQLTFEEGSA